MASDSVRHTLWGDKWRNAVERSFSLYAKLEARAVDIKISGRTIDARVVDGSWSSQRTVLMLSRFSEEEETALMDALKKNAPLAGSLAHRLEPKETLDFVQSIGLKMLPGPGVKFSVKCSCGMRGMCSHAYAALFAVGKKIDRNPFTVFTVRGLDIGSIAEECTQASWESELSLSREKRSLPAFTDKFILKTLDGSERSSDTAEFEPLKIPDVRKAVLNAVVPNAIFKDSFVHEYREILLEIFSKSFERYPEKSVDLEEARTVRYIGKSHWMFGTLPFTWALDAVSVESPTGMSKADASARLLDLARKISLEILNSGAVYPKLFAIDDRTARFFWLPLCSIPEVQKNLELLQERIPPKFVRSEMESPKLFVENSAEMLVIAILSTYLQNGVEKSFQDDALHAIFGDATLDFSSGRASSDVQEFEKWLSGYEISEDSFLPIVNGADAGFGKIDIDLDFVDKLTGEVYPFSKLWTRDFPSEKRNDVLRAILPIRNYIEGYDDYVSQKATDNIHLSGEGVIHFLNSAVPLFRVLGVSFDLPKGLERIIRGLVRPQIVRSEEKAKAGFSRLENLLQLNWSVLVGEHAIDGKEFLEKYADFGGLLYDDGQYFYVTSEDEERLKDGLKNRFKVPAIKVLQIALSGEFDGFSVDIAPEALAEIHRFKKESEEEVTIPPQIQANLRPYQKRGFAWMLGNSRLGFGSIIADDMGLGKTLQVITLLQQMKNDGAFAKKKALVIVPSGLLQNWKRELGKFAPELLVNIYHGGNRSLENSPADIFVTTYGVLRSDKEMFKNTDWQVAVLDEAQNIKNAETSQSRIVKSLPAHIKIAMSGTPVENRLMEFWSIMDFCNHGLLGNAKSFREEFEKPIQECSNRHRAELFQKITSPFLLRRLKTDKSIISDLPEKLEQDEWASLSPEQETLYKKTFSSYMEAIASLNEENPEQKFERSAKVLRLILALKQICNHPAQYLKDGKLDSELSGKAELFLDILESILDTDEKVLVFTQFTEMGEILEKIIREKFKTKTLFYHGGLSLSARENVISEFEKNPERKILILSLKAGGTGLNLTAASQVIHYDLWWNPAVEAQATDRAYRIGQNRRVVVHRLITKGTFEEKINAIIESKRKISEMTVATGENWIAKLSDDELREVFTLGKG